MKVYYPFEPMLRVGIVEGGGFGIRLEGKYAVSADDNVIHYQPISEDSVAEISGVEIGKEFHWNRREKQRFKGTIIVRNDGTKSSLVNVVKLEIYLRSVISSEMNPQSHIEFLKAHTIISRSWVLRMMQRHQQFRTESSENVLHQSDCGRYISWTDVGKHSDYDVCADDHCQRYQGEGKVNEAAREAVISTRGMVLLDSNEDIVDARFSKCCGGQTEEFSACWGDSDYAYLQSVADPYCHPSRSKAVKHLILNDYDRPTDDYYEWRSLVSSAKISENLYRNYGLTMQVEGLYPLKRGKSGRIVELEIFGSGQKVIIGKELAIRRLLSDSHLYSSAFDIIEQTTDAGKMFELQGKGWGHGVGLCQIGAAVMAAEGYTYEEILRYYYKNTKIEKLYD